ncbi:MAG: hypothetical protein ACRC2T_06260 [Thermoguttaceae bacterium]
MTQKPEHECPRNPERRRLLEKMMLGSAGLAGAALLSCEEKTLAAQLLLESETAGAAGSVGAKPDAVAGATRKIVNWAKLEDLKKKPPKRKIGKLNLSRMILGGNLFGGWAHARDLLYVSDLVTAYNTPEKIHATFQLAQACGINAFLSHYSHYEMIKRYWDAGGDMHFFADCRSPEETRISMEQGASACYINGEKTDELVAAEKFDVLEAHLEQVRKEGVVAGLGAHRLSTVQKATEKGFKPDFWMKTFHHNDYWSAKPKTEHDNIFCREPVETAEFMKTLGIPWIAFKTLAAGAIHPQVGFKYAYDAGADFLCVGMYDFQIVDDVNIAVEILDAMNA